MDYSPKPSCSGRAKAHGSSSGFQPWGSRVDRTILREDYRSGLDRVSLKEERVSIMLSVLPTSIQSRLPRVPSIRRTMISPMKAGYSSRTSSGTATPDSEADDVMDMPRGASAMIAERYEYLHQKDYLSSLDAVQTSPSGVDWRSGRQGLDLVINAAQEAKARPNPNYSTTFERKVYVDGLAYLLNGLPRDLDRGELAVLSRSMPLSLVEELEPTDRPCRRMSDGAGSRNWVHSGLVFVLLYLLSWVRWAAPYVLLVISAIMRYEREYKVSENVLGTTMAGFTMGLGVMKKMGDGLAGQVLADALEYTAQGVSGALKELAEEEFTSKSWTRRR